MLGSSLPERSAFAIKWYKTGTHIIPQRLVKEASCDNNCTSIPLYQMYIVKHVNSQVRWVGNITYQIYKIMTNNIQQMYSASIT